MNIEMILETINKIETKTYYELERIKNRKVCLVYKENAYGILASVAAEKFLSHYGVHLHDVSPHKKSNMYNIVLKIDKDIVYLVFENGMKMMFRMNDIFPSIDKAKRLKKKSAKFAEMAIDSIGKIDKKAGFTKNKNMMTAATLTILDDMAEDIDFVKKVIFGSNPRVESIFFTIIKYMKKIKNIKDKISYFRKMTKSNDTKSFKEFFREL